MLCGLLCAHACYSQISNAQITNDAFGDLFDDLSLQEAFDESIAQSKLLILYVDSRSIPYADPDRSSASIESAQRDRLLRFWLKQHSIILHLGAEDQKLAEQIANAALYRCEKRKLNLEDGVQPHEQAQLAWYTPSMGIFLNGQLFSAVSVCRLSPCSNFGAPGAGKDNDLGTSMTWAVFELDFQFDRIRAKEPVWFGLHELRNPPLEAEAKTYFSEIEDAAANRFGDERTEYPDDVFSVINLARTQAELGDRFGSAATYTWLWERGAQRDPDFGPAIRKLVAADVQQLVHRWENFEERFNDMKYESAKRIGLETLDEFADWIRLAAVTGDPLAQLSELDYRINSDYFGSLMPRDERRVLLMIAETECEIMERLALPAEERDTLSRLILNYEHEKSDIAKPELRRLATDQAVLLHARMLEEGLESEARAVARQAIERLGTDVGPAIVAGALVAGHPRPWHRDYLSDDGSPSKIAEHLLWALEQQEADSGELLEIRVRE